MRPFPEKIDSPSALTQEGRESARAVVFFGHLPADGTCWPAMT
jgi:hypothetical protein